MKIKTFTWIALLATICGAGLAYFPERTSDQEIPLAYYQQGEFSQALAYLEKNKRTYGDADYLLQKSYILQEIGRGQEADRLLLTLAQGETADPNVFSEACLNLLLSAYCDNNRALLEKHLSGLQRFLGNENKWVSLFMGIAFFNRGEHGKALEAFNTSGGRGYLSPWMEQRFSKTFSPYWFAKHRVECQIGVGALQESRETLAHEKMTFVPAHQDEFYALYSQSYLAEAQKKSYEEAVPYYRMAIGHLSRVDDPKTIGRQKNLLLEGAHTRIRQILSEQDFEDLPFYVEIEEQWGDEQAADRLRKLLTSTLDHQLVQGDRTQLEELAKTLSYLLEENRVRKEIGLRFEHLLEQALRKGEAEQLFSYWQMMLIFQDEDERINGKFSDLAAQKVLEAIFSDDSALTKTDALLNFYLVAEEKESDSEQMADQLVAIAEKYWEIPQQREKSIALLQAALRASPHHYQGNVQAALEELFKRRYAYALERDTVSELFDLIAAVDTLEIANVDVSDRQKLQKQLEDAESLYLQGRLLEALRKAEWVLALDAENVRARRLVGMVSYYFADYGKAADYLQGVPPVNDEMREAHAVVAILSGQSEQGIKWLEEVEKTRPIQPQIYLRLAYGFLTQDDPAQAVQWLAKVDEKNPEVLPAQMFASFQMDSWYETVELFKKMPPPYVNLDGFHGIVVDAYTALGDIEQAETALRELLRKPPQPDESNFSPYFRTFMKNKLNQWNRYFVAGSYFKIVRNDPRSALRYFERIDNPSLQTLVEKAEAYFQLGRVNAAKDTLLQINREAGAGNLEIKLRILPLLGATLEQMGYYAESVPFYEEYFKLNPDDADHRYAFIRVLMQLKRDDLALEQVARLKEIRELKPEEQTAWMQALLHRGDFDQVDKLANRWLSNQKVPLAQMLQIAEMMIVTDNRPLLDYIVKEIPEPSQRTIEDNQKLILLQMKMGDFAQALDLAQLLERSLKQTPAGLLVLARLYMKLDQEEQAFSFAERALQIDPTNVEVLDFFDQQQQSADVMVPLVELLKDKVEANPGNITIQIDYAKKLIDLSIEAYLSNQISTINDSIDLKQARLTLEKLQGKGIELPEVHVLLGKIYYLMALYERAGEELQRALYFDPSYIEALRHLALVYEAKNKKDGAKEALETAARFSPSDSNVWEQLGNLSVEMQDWRRAVDAYQNSIRFAPFDPDPYLQLASSYLTVNQPVDAAKTLEGLLAFSPQSAQGLSLILKALYHPLYVKQNRDAELLQRTRIDYYDRLRMIDPDLAKHSLPEGVSLDPE